MSLTEINDQINELLKAAVQSEGVISLFDSSKSGGENFSLFDPAVLDEISRMKEKNIAVEILKNLWLSKWLSTREQMWNHEKRKNSINMYLK